MSLRPPATAPRADLLRSIPFWILLVGSIASAAVGVWLILSKIDTMTTTLADGSATGVEVYAGQSWVILGGALLAAGLFGLIAVLALAVARSFVTPRAADVVEVVDWTTAHETAGDEDEVELAAAAPTLGYEDSLGYTPKDADASAAPVTPEVDEDTEKPAATPAR